MPNKKEIRYRDVVMLVAVLLAAVLAFEMLLLKNEGQVVEVTLDEYSQDQLLEWELKGVELNEGRFTIICRFYKDGEEISSFENHVLLQETETKTTYMLPTSSLASLDPYDQNSVMAMHSDKVRSVAEAGDDCQYIIASVKADHFDFENKDYKIILLYESNGSKLYLDTQLLVRECQNE